MRAPSALGKEREMQSHAYRVAAENTLLPGVYHLHVVDVGKAGGGGRRFGHFFHGENQIVSLQHQSTMLAGTACS